MYAMAITVRRAKVPQRECQSRGRGLQRRIASPRAEAQVVPTGLTIAWSLTLWSAVEASVSRKQKSEVTLDATIWYAASALGFLPVLGGVAHVLPITATDEPRQRGRLAALSILYLVLELRLALSEDPDALAIVVVSLVCGLQCNVERIIAIAPEKLPTYREEQSIVEKDEWDRRFVDRNVDPDDRRWPD